MIPAAKGGVMRTNLVLSLLGLFLFLAGVAGPASAAPTSPLDFLEVLNGPAEVQTRGNWLFVTFGAKDSGRDRIFRVEAADLSTPISFQTSSSRILYWDGHLILLDQKQNRAWHFWIPGVDERNKALPGARPEAEGLKALLADYEVIRVVAYEISSHSWLKGLRPTRPDGLLNTPLMYQPDNQDPGGAGVGTCGTKCSITCGDNSQCETSCGSNRCATCTCPASCSCS